MKSETVERPAAIHPARTSPIFRPGTNDRYVWQSVAIGNEYFVSDHFGDGDVIVDIGLHIGSFSCLVLSRGAGHVYGYEPDHENYTRACDLLSCFGARITIEKVAVCRSDSPPAHLLFSGYKKFANGIMNTGGGDVLSPVGGTPVMTIPFDNVIDRATQRGERRIRLLKLDCEGSEYPLLMTSKRLDYIDEIVGEFHVTGPNNDGQEIPLAARIDDITNFDSDTISTFLRDHGFLVRTGGRYGAFGKFLAWNRCSLSRIS
jgi:FkbM family methyltransferase